MPYPSPAIIATSARIGDQWDHRFAIDEPDAAWELFGS
jgi:hypothetical protein